MTEYLCLKVGGFEPTKRDRLIVRIVLAAVLADTAVLVLYLTGWIPAWLAVLL